MSKYTTTIKNLVENGFDLGLKDYPIFDESYREHLNDMIIKHYYISEIGFETAELFKMQLNNRMEEIMPYYNALYNLQKDLLESGIDMNVNLTESYTHNVNTDGTSTSSSNSNTDNKNVSQNTPQGNLTQSNINNFSYADNISFGGANSNVNDNSKTTGKTVEDYIKKIQGNNGNRYAYEVLIGVKNNLLAIDIEVINQLEDLFMGIF